MKALILAAGRGKRLGDMTSSTNKCMIKVRGKPLIEYNLDRVADCRNDITEIIIVVGYKREDIIMTYGSDYKDIPIQYVFQADQKGLVDAIECSKDALDGQDFFLLLGDEYLRNSHHKEMVEFFKSSDAIGVCGIFRQDVPSEISKTYTMIMNNSTIARLIEKPRHPLNDIQGTGHCIFKNEILDYIQYTPIHYLRKEKELPDLIQAAIDNGKQVKVFNCCDGYNNINTESDLSIVTSK